MVLAILVAEFLLSLGNTPGEILHLGVKHKHFKGGGGGERERERDTAQTRLCFERL